MRGETGGAGDPQSNQVVLKELDNILVHFHNRRITFLNNDKPVTSTLLVILICQSIISVSYTHLTLPTKA